MQPGSEGQEENRQGCRPDANAWEIGVAAGPRSPFSAGSCAVRTKCRSRSLLSRPYVRAHSFRVHRSLGGASVPTRGNPLERGRGRECLHRGGGDDSHARAKRSACLGAGRPPHTRADGRLPAQATAQARRPRGGRQRHHLVAQAVRRRYPARLAAAGRRQRRSSTCSG
jgi:hypothetical protein